MKDELPGRGFNNGHAPITKNPIKLFTFDDFKKGELISRDQTPPKDPPVHDSPPDEDIAPLSLDYTDHTGPPPPLLQVYTARDWMEIAEQQDIPRRLFDDFWYEGDTNLGKSILAVQIADSISRGVPIPGFAMEARQQPVIYFDFELRAKQFQARYTDNYKDPWKFSEDFYRAELDPRASYAELGYDSFESCLHAQIEGEIKDSDFRVIIIDNLSALTAEMEQSKEAKPIMQMLNSLKKQYNLSILVVAHTPKRDSSRPLSENDLQGSKMFSNLTDSIFAIGKSNNDPRIRYIKQMKGRSTEKMYEEDNVCLCQITKERNFLRFELMGYGREYDQIRTMEEKERGTIIAAVRDMHAAGKTQREISIEMGISLGSVNKYINKT